MHTTRSAREPLSCEGHGPARGRAQAHGTRNSSLLVGRNKPGSIRLLRLLLAACALIEVVLTFRLHPVAPTAAAPAASVLCGLSASLSFMPRRAVSHLVVDSLDAASSFVAADDANICRIVRAAPDALTRASPSAWSPRPGEASAVVDYLDPRVAALEPVLALAVPEWRSEVMGEILQLGTFFQTLLQCKAIETRLEVMDAKVLPAGPAALRAERGARPPCRLRWRSTT